MLVAVVAAVALEALLLVAVAVFFAVEVVVARPSDPVLASAVAALALLVGVFLAACARALWFRRRWARAPVVTWQLLTLFAVLPSVLGASWWAALVLLVLCVVAGAGLLTPKVVAETTARGRPPVT